MVVKSEGTGEIYHSRSSQEVPKSLEIRCKGLKGFLNTTEGGDFPSAFPERLPT
jgi:hypothetical protein